MCVGTRDEGFPSGLTGITGVAITTTSAVTFGVWVSSVADGAGHCCGCLGYRSGDRMGRSRGG